MTGTHLPPPVKGEESKPRQGPQHVHNKPEEGSAAARSPREEQAGRSSPLFGSRFGAQDHTAQPLEPILFPKLRIYFADFPYLHCSMRLEAFHLGDLMRL